MCSVYAVRLFDSTIVHSYGTLPVGVRSPKGSSQNVNYLRSGSCARDIPRAGAAPADTYATMYH